MQKADRFVDVCRDAVNAFKTIAAEHDGSLKAVESLENRVRELSANKIVLETRLYDAGEREIDTAKRISELESRVVDLTERLNETEACSNERSTVIDRLKSLIDPLRKAVAEMGM